MNVAHMLALSPRLVGLPRPILIEPGDVGDSTHREPSVDEEQPFYEAFGRAMAMWQFVETSLVVVQQATDRSDNRQRNAAAFHKELKFTRRVGLVTAAFAKVEPLGFWAGQWPKHASKLRTAGAVRNRIAHALIYFDPKCEPGSRLFLGVNLRNPDRWEEFKSAKRFDARSLLEAAASFCELHNEVRGFAQHVSEDHDRLRAAYPQIFSER